MRVEGVQDCCFSGVIIDFGVGVVFVPVRASSSLFFSYFFFTKVVQVHVQRGYLGGAVHIYIADTMVVFLGRLSRVLLRATAGAYVHGFFLDGVASFFAVAVGSCIVPGTE